MATFPLLQVVPITLRARSSSADGTVKLAYMIPEGGRVETCLLDLAYREIPLVVCVSTQVGCPFDCKFCAVGLTTYERNLTAEEILYQITLSRQNPWWQSRMGSQYEVAAMGTGEPMLVLPQLIGAIRIAKAEDDGLISLNVATVGLPEKIREYANEEIDGVKLSLQLSLHGSTDEQRWQVMPSASRFGIGKVIAAASDFARSKQTCVTVNYLLFEGLNDSFEDARRLAAMLNPRFFTIKVSAFNPVPGAEAVPASYQRLFEFSSWLKEQGLSARVFSSAGVDIGAGCGQFSNAPLDLLL